MLEFIITVFMCTTTDVSTCQPIAERVALYRSVEVCADIESELLGEALLVARQEGLIEEGDIFAIKCSPLPPEFSV